MPKPWPSRVIPDVIVIVLVATMSRVILTVSPSAAEESAEVSSENVETSTVAARTTGTNKVHVDHTTSDTPMTSPADVLFQVRRWM